MTGRWRYLLVMATAFVLVVPSACNGPVAATSSSRPSPAPSATSSAAYSLWRTTVLDYPDDILTPATRATGERVFPYRDIEVSPANQQLMDASTRYAVLTDPQSSQLRLVDLRTGASGVILPSPLTLRKAPSPQWAKAEATMLRRVGRAGLQTEFLRLQISGSRLAWQEALCVTTGGFDVTASAVFTARILPGMRLGTPKLVALGQPHFVADPTGGWYTGGGALDFAFDDQRIVLFSGGGYWQSGKSGVCVFNTATNRRTALIDAPRDCSMEVALCGKRAVLCLMGSRDSAHLLSYNLDHAAVPVASALLPATDLPLSDVRDFVLSADGSLAWSKYWSNEMSVVDHYPVYLLAPGAAVRCLGADGGQPAFFGKTVLWLHLAGNHFRIGGANTQTLEAFTLAGGDNVTSWSIGGSGHTAVVTVSAGDRDRTTLRVFDVR